MGSHCSAATTALSGAKRLAPAEIRNIVQTLSMSGRTKSMSEEVLLGVWAAHFVLALSAWCTELVSVRSWSAGFLLKDLVGYTPFKRQSQKYLHFRYHC